MLSTGKSLWQWQSAGLLFAILFLLPACKPRFNYSRPSLVSGAGAQDAGGECGDGVSVCTSDTFVRAPSGAQVGLGLNNLTDALRGGAPMPYLIAAGSLATDGTHAIATAFDGSGNATALLNPSYSNCAAQLKLANVTTATGLTGIVFRHDGATNNDNTWGLLADPANVMGSGAGYVLVKQVGGAPSFVANSVIMPANGDIIRVELDGTRIVAKINGARVFDVNDSALQSNTHFGFSIAVDTGIQLGDFLLEQCH